MGLTRTQTRTRTRTRTRDLTSALAVDFDYNHEMLVGGVSTVTAALLGGSPAYSQTKFNVLNQAMTH